MELGLLLEDMGHEVAGFATTRDGALALAGESSIDLALVDVHLSDGPTGFEVGRTLAERGVSVLFVTGNPDMVSAITHPVIGVLAKPTDQTLIADAVTYALARRAGRDLSPPAALRRFA